MTMEMHGIVSVLRHQYPLGQNFQMSDLLPGCHGEGVLSDAVMLKGLRAGGSVAWWFKGWN